MNTPSTPSSTTQVGAPGLRQIEITPAQLIYLEGILAIFIATGSLTWPLGGDHSFFYFVGNSILHGGVPYRDAWELKGPLTYYLCAAILAVFGRHEISIRVFDLMAIGLFCWWLNRTAVCVEGRLTPGATFMVVLFCLQFLCIGLACTAQPDEWGGFLIAVAVTLLLESSWSPTSTMVAIGILVAMATLLKPTFLIFLPLPLLYPPCTRRGWMSSLKLRGVCVLACAATITLALGIIFRNGGFEDYLDLLYFLPSSYFPFSQRHLMDEARLLPLDLWELGLTIPYVLAFPAIGLIRHNGYKRLARILSTWFALGILLVLAQGTYWPYTFIPATIAAAVILGNCLSLFGRETVTPFVRNLATGFAVLVIGVPVVASHYLSDTLFGSLAWPPYVLGVLPKPDYMLRVANGYPGSLDRVAAYIDSHSNDEDTIFLWCWDIRVLAIGRRQSASRFGTFEALITQGPLQAKYRQLFMGDITRRPPRYIVVDYLESTYRPESSLWLLKDFTEFNRFLQEHYRLETQIGQYELWVKT